MSMIPDKMDDDLQVLALSGLVTTLMVIGWAIKRKVKKVLMKKG